MFNGKSSPQMPTNSVSVLDALSMRARPQGELAPRQRFSIEFGLEPGTKKSMGLGLLTLDSPDDCKALPFAKLKIRTAALQLCQTSQVWMHPGARGFVRLLYDLLHSTSNKLVYDRHGALSTDLAQTPLQPRLGWTWLADQGIAEEPGNPGYASRRRSRGPLSGKKCWFEWTPDGPGDEALPIMPGNGNLILLSSAFDICEFWLANEAIIDGLTSGQKEETRAHLGHQLYEVRVGLVSSPRRRG